MNDRTNSTDVRLALVSLQSIYTSGLGLCCTFPSKLTSLACSYVSALGTGVRQSIHGKGCHYIHMEFGFGRGAVCYQCIRGGATHPVDIKPVQSPQHFMLKAQPRPESCSLKVFISTYVNIFSANKTSSTLKSLISKQAFHI